ncbi:MAG: class I SAM-dependent methyltransferase family protein [Theionarchaea archaeon]|nr:class I SAM-dependent methyltransferase family protein [Theionarchaea archaeon]
MESCIRKMIWDSLYDLPEASKKILPEKYEKIGNILIIYLDSSLACYRKEIGEAYKKAFKVKTVLQKGRIEGEFRVPQFEVIAGSDTQTVHKENTIQYHLDLSKVMFSAGNIHERIRMSKLPHREKVVDMFAGIGYFTLPIAKFCHSHVDALEKNKDAFHFLLKNIILNSVEPFVTPHLVDCKDFEGKAQRVIMGHPRAYKYLDKAFQICEKGFIHYHEFAPEGKCERARTRLQNAAEKAGKSIVIDDIRKIKKFSPGVWHLVYDVQILSG